jgi:hypothetical protein
MRLRPRLGLVLLICFHIVTCSFVTLYVAEFYARPQIVMFDKMRLYAKALTLRFSQWSQFVSHLASAWQIANWADCLTIDDPNATDYHSAPAE